MCFFFNYKFQRTFSEKRVRDEHLATCSRAYASVGGVGPEGIFNKKESAIDNAIQLFTYKFPKTGIPDIGKLKNASTVDALKLLMDTSQSNPTKNYKINLVLFAEFYMAINVEQVTNPPIIFHSENFQLLPGGDEMELLDILEQIFSNFIIELENFTSRGSGYVLGRIIRLDVSIAESDVLRAGTFIDLPKALKNAKKGLINIRNGNDFCILYIFTAWAYSRQNPPVKFINPERVYNYDAETDMKRWKTNGLFKKRANIFVLREYLRKSFRLS